MRIVAIDYNNEMIEMAHISEIALFGLTAHPCLGGRTCAHDSAWSLRGGRHGERSAQLHAGCLHQVGMFAGEDAVDYIGEHDFAEIDMGQVDAEMTRVLAPTKREDGIPPNQIEYKTRRLVNDYLQPPKVTRKMLLAQDRFAEVRDDLEADGRDGPA